MELKKTEGMFNFLSPSLFGNIYVEMAVSCY